MSAADSNIITGTQVRDITGRAEGVEDRKLDAAIHEAQHELEQVLGVTLYAEVEAAYEDTPQWDGRADLETLYEGYLRYYLAWKTLENAYPDLYAEPDRNGVFTRSGEDYQSVSVKGLSMLIAKARSRAERWQIDLLRYIRGLDASTAVRVSYDTCVEDEPRVGKTYRGGVVTRMSRWQTQYGLGDRHRWGWPDDDHCCDEH